MSNSESYIDTQILWKNNLSFMSNMRVSKEKAIADLIVSIYDTPKEVKIPLAQPEFDFITGNNAIDIEEFTDTKEQYNQKIKQITQYCISLGVDLTGIKIPTFEDIINHLSNYNSFSSSRISGELLQEKYINEELKKAEIVSQENQYQYKYTTFSNGTIISYDTKTAESSITTIDKANNKKYLTKYSAVGEKMWCRVFDLDTDKETRLFWYKDLIEAQTIAKDLAQDLTNKNWLGQTKIRKSLPENIEKINKDNVLFVMEEYYKIMKTSLLDDIPEEYGNSYIFLIEQLKEYCENLDEIPDMESFMQSTGINEYMKNNCSNYAEYRYEWEYLTGRISFESDFMNSNLSLKNKAKYNMLVYQEACERFAEGNFVPNLKIENVTTKNEYYKSNMVYDVQFGKLFEPIIIKNQTTGRQRTLDLSNITKEMSLIDKRILWSQIQTYPAEVLEDMAIELQHVEGHSGNEKELRVDNFDGLYRGDDSCVIFNSNWKDTNVHETGHAIDYTYRTGSNSNETAKSSFFEAFEQEINNYKAKGNQCFIKGENGNSTGLDGYYNYCTYNEREMFAECYTLLMLGDCNSKECILKHFPNCLREAKKILEEIRKMPDDIRLNQNI